MTNLIDNCEEITKVNWCKIFRKVWTKKSNDVKKSRSRERNSFHWGVVAITRMRFTIRPGRRGFARRPSVFGGTLDALKWPHPPSCYLYRDTQHTHARRARARGCCTRAALMSHDCIQIPSFFFHASALFHRARERSVSLSRFFCRRWKWRLLERDATWRNERDREHSFFLLFLLFFNTRGRKFYWRKVRPCRMTLIFWCIIILERVYIDKSRRLM